MVWTTFICILSFVGSTTIALDFDSSWHSIVDLPGVEHIELSIDKNMLVVQAERKHAHQVDDDFVHSVERSYGKVQRKFAIPPRAEMDKADAELKDGVLTVKFPKMPVEKDSAVKKLEIKRGDHGK